MVTAQFKYNNKDIKLSTLFENDIIYNRDLKNNRFYELGLLNKIMSLNKTGTYIDLGANIGNHSIYFGLFCKCDYVISIEAEPTIFDVLTHNIQQNNLKSKINTFQTAISNFDGLVSMDNLNQRNIGGTSISDKNNGNVKCTTLDKLLPNIQDVSILKIDIEGEELNAIKGAINLIQNNSPVIITELKTNKEFQEFKHFISEYGYNTDGVNYAISPTYIWMK